MIVGEVADHLVADFVAEQLGGGMAAEPVARGRLACLRFGPYCSIAVVVTKPVLDANRRRTLRRWLWFLAAYLVMVYVLLLLAGQIAGPSPSDIGWSD
jgi:hypothetical protein